MCYGNSSVSTYQGGSVGAVYDSHFKLIWHLPNGSTLSVNDSTSLGNNGANGGATAASTEIDGGASVDGSHQITRASNAGLAVDTGDFTISLWMKTVNVSSFAAIYDKGDASNTRDYSLFMNAGKLAFYGVGASGAGVTGTHTINDGGWHYVVWIRSSGTNT
jgi:hypothetical protein